MRAICFSFLLLVSPLASSDTLSGKIVSVHDGDTATLLNKDHQTIKIRLAQIDAPESDQAFGQKSRQSLAEMIFNRDVRVERETTDRYGRMVGTIYLENLDINQEQIRKGMAWVYREYLHDPALIEVETNAKMAKLGLWADPTPLPPWEYRHGRKSDGFAKKMAKNNSENPLNSGQCGKKQFCKEMTSCSEARFYLDTCQLKRLDGDSDGIPCEKICLVHH